MDCTPRDRRPRRDVPSALRRTSICRCSTRATACWRRCGGPTRSRTTRRSSIGIRARIPHASIGSDIIVGFPGETDEDFAQLASYLERSPLTHVHVFPYSDRPGTRGVGDARQGARRRRSRARAPRPRDRRSGWPTAFRASQVGTRAPRPDARGRLARRDRQLSEGEDSAGPRRATNGCASGHGRDREASRCIDGRAAGAG